MVAGAAGAVVAVEKDLWQHLVVVAAQMVGCVGIHLRCSLAIDPNLMSF